MLIMVGYVADVIPFCVADERSPRWYFDKKRLIDENPNRKCGIDIERETYLRQQAALHVTEMGQRLHMPTLCVCSAIVYLHRFYVFHTFNRFPYSDMSAAALFLAAKAQECPKKLEYVVKVSYALQHREEPPLETKSDKYLEESQKIITLENILLKTLGFETEVELPHLDIVRYAQRFKGPRDLAQASYFLCSQTLNVTPLYCLRYRPSFVACVCMYMACTWTNWELPEHDNRPFYNFIDPEATKESLEALSNEMGNYCDQMGESCRIKRHVSQIRRPLLAANGSHAPAAASLAAPPSYKPSVHSLEFRYGDDNSMTSAYLPKKPANTATVADGSASLSLSVDSSGYGSAPSSVTESTVVQPANSTSYSLAKSTFGPVPTSNLVSMAACSFGTVCQPVGSIHGPTLTEPVTGSSASSTHSMTPLSQHADQQTPGRPEGASPPLQPFKRLKTEVLDLNRYKERRSLLAASGSTPSKAATPQTMPTTADRAPQSQQQQHPPVRKSFMPDVSSVAVALAAEPSALPDKKPSSSRSANRPAPAPVTKPSTSSNAPKPPSAMPIKKTPTTPLKKPPPPPTATREQEKSTKPASASKPSDLTNRKPLIASTASYIGLSPPLSKKQQENVDLTSYAEAALESSASLVERTVKPLVLTPDRVSFPAPEAASKPETSQRSSDKKRRDARHSDLEANAKRSKYGTPDDEIQCKERAEDRAKKHQPPEIVDKKVPSSSRATGAPNPVEPSFQTNQVIQRKEISQTPTLDRVDAKLRTIERTDQRRVSSSASSDQQQHAVPKSSNDKDKDRHHHRHGDDADHRRHRQHHHDDERRRRHEQHNSRSSSKVVKELTSSSHETYAKNTVSQTFSDRTRRSSKSEAAATHHSVKGDSFSHPVTNKWDRHRYSDEEEGEISDSSDTNPALMSCSRLRLKNSSHHRSSKSSLVAPPPIPPPPLPPSPGP